MTHSCDGPYFEPGLIGANGRLARLHKGANQEAALREQRLGRELSAKQHAESMQLARQQMEMSKQIEIPEYKPPSPPTSVGVDAIEAGRDYRRNTRRRFGAGRSVFAGESPKYQRPALGGAVQLAA
jgi:hypothetical protein